MPTTARRVVRTLLLGLICTLAATTAAAQRRERTVFQFQHTSWTAKDGAPAVAALAQTTDGYLWMGGSVGLYRFDGIRFERYRAPSGEAFRSDDIRSLMASPDGGLWIGYGGGGADFLKDGRITSHGDAEGLPRGMVFAVAVDHDGTVWAATQTGLARLTGSSWERIGDDWGYPGTGAVALLVDRAGTLWVAPGSSLFYLPRGERRFRKGAEQLDGTAASIAQGPDGTLWLSRLSGNSLQTATARAVRPLDVLHEGGETPVPRIFSLDSVSVSLVDHAGSLWMTSQDGVFRVAYPERLETHRTTSFDDPAFEHFTERDGLTIDRVYPVLEDRDGNIWVGSDRGLDRFREGHVIPITPLIGALVAGEDADAWVIRWAFPQGQLVHLRGLTATAGPIDATPLIAARGASGTIWMGGREGIWRLVEGRAVRMPVPEGTTRLSVFRAIAEDRAGNVWVSIEPRGVFRWSRGVWTHAEHVQGLPALTASALLADRAGRTWFGYEGSRVALLDGERVSTFTAADGLGVVNVQTIYEHGERVWVGGQGLAVFTQGRFHTLAADGDLLRGISGIVETADGDLWLNTLAGILRVPAAAVTQALGDPGYRLRPEIFDFQDGLTGTAVQIRPTPTAIAGADGRLWFLTYDNIVQIDPSHLRRSSSAPSVFVRSLEAAGTSHAPAERIALPPRTTAVHIEYTAPNLSAPQRVRFRYTLEGLDDGWHDVGPRREAFYTNLRPGAYRFRVMAANDEGAWNDGGAVVEFTIAPAWFQTAWFLAGCAISAALLMWAAYRWRVRQVTWALGVRFDERLAERTRLARELHDTFLQTIQGSKLVADDALDAPADPVRMRRTLEQLSAWLGRATEEGRAALNSLRSSAVERNDLAEAFRRAIDECGMQSELDAELSVVGEPDDMHPIVRDEVYRIGYEAIRNACVHAQASRLRVALTYAEDLTLTVRDDGVGMNAAVAQGGREGHFGLQGMRERAERIAGTLAIVTAEATGTEVTLVVPGAIVFRRSPSAARRLSQRLRSLLNGPA